MSHAWLCVRVMIERPETVATYLGEIKDATKSLHETAIIFSESETTTELLEKESAYRCNDKL